MVMSKPRIKRKKRRRKERIKELNSQIRSMMIKVKHPQLQANRIIQILKIMIDLNTILWLVTTCKYDINYLKFTLLFRYADSADDSEDEGIKEYQVGGYHPVHLGEVLIGRYVIV
jgi:hypothetical protein